MLSYKQITPATDWFYVDSSTNNDVIIYHIAAWGLTHDDSVIGLISVKGAQHWMPDRVAVARLITVPPSNSGMYKHKNELTEWESKTLDNERFRYATKSNLAPKKLIANVELEV